ncbi:unnamed protein product [Heligmosomoides polygyrus]|uniref:Uncharacterized protein n=1 Tax=Heligmosomoides polygyrus TaxID=6339 RepID=A0A183GCN5_HELPZ|nr:unnamed protein product [Heligmosomoides polygyrus]
MMRTARLDTGSLVSTIPLQMLVDALQHRHDMNADVEKLISTAACSTMLPADMFSERQVVEYRDKVKIGDVLKKEKLETTSTELKQHGKGEKIARAQRRQGESCPNFSVMP